MKKEDLLAIAQETAKKIIKSEHDLNELTQMLSKITIEAALNAELDDHLDYDKHEVSGRRRMGVVLARDDSVDAALAKAKAGSGQVVIKL